METEQQPWWRPAVAEFIGTLTLVFVGAGAFIALSHMSRGASDASAATVLVGTALAHGLAIATMILALGHLSGGHFNPAVTVGALFARRIKLDLGLIYIVFQLLGAVAGAFLLVAALPTDWWRAVDLGTPGLALGVDPAKAFLAELVLTFFLVLVIFGTAMDERNPSRVVAGLAIGLAVAMGVLMGGSVTGAAMNPARAFGPALISRTWAYQGIYWAGPLLGGILAGLVYDTAYLMPLRKAEQKTREASEAAPPEAPAA